MLSCIGDVDIMVLRTFTLAIPQGHPPPAQLPAEFHGRVSVYKIIDSEFPGYVFLVKSYKLTEITGDGKYNAVQCQREYVGYDLFSNGENDNMKGPAFVRKHEPSAVTASVSSTDTVFCICCLSWPPQAADWPTRHRNYGWPDSATLDRVVSNGWMSCGCHIVFVDKMNG